MEYTKTYFLHYLSASEETRKESKNHWLNIFTREFSDGQDYSLSASILAAIALADDVIASGYISA